MSLVGLLVKIRAVLVVGRVRIMLDGYFHCAL